MISLHTYIAPPSPCGYLPDRQWSLEYEFFLKLRPADYMERMRTGWRRFGFTVFRPHCASCDLCRSIRIDPARFRPNRSQRRAWAANENEIRVVVGEPEVSEERLDLYDRYHAFQADSKEWPDHGPKDPDDYRLSFIDNPFPTEEWRYYLGDALVGVGYVDVLPEGLSAIYFYYDPAHRDRSLGTWNVLRLIEETRRRGLAHLYLGYHVAGCRSLEYKANFRPNETLGVDGKWRPFRTSDEK
jgi:leucyl-tRNA---protein transferase